MLKVQACDISDKSGDDFNFVSKPKSAKSEIKLSNKSPNKEEVNEKDKLDQFTDVMDKSFDRMIQREEEKVAEINVALQELHSTLVHANSTQKTSISLQNEDNEDESVTREDVKNWALSQKKLN